MISDVWFDGPPGAPVLVLANPLGTTRALWDPVLPALTRRFRVLRFELPGHGGTRAPHGPYTLSRLGTAVLDLLHEAGLVKVAYAGVSIGGMIGLWLAAHAPERVSSLAVCCTALMPMPSASAWESRASLVRSSGMDALAGLVVPRWFTPGFVVRSPERVSAVLDMLRGVDPSGYAGCCEAIASMDLPGLLGLVRAPTLAVAGTEDIAAPPWQAARIARAVPGARLRVLRGASHLAVWETPGPVVDALLNHLPA